ncbi:SpoIIE family protein phosphatase [Actinomadura rayongensis]|uniref:SpoIIE family protein phosphatase n=1 Tax=Actinomadura rayongensis TaxID=1429076 RepID=A0A6I4WBH4_9ACTN|nr:SpoIIE family protein phosphatase [Actinomadura rayongensis]
MSGSTESWDVLGAAELASPVAAVDVVTDELARRFGATSVSFLFADILGRELVRLGPRSAGVAGRAAPRIELRGSVYDKVLRTQRPATEHDLASGGVRLIVPVSNRGDVIGLLELTVAAADDPALRAIRAVAHALAYMVVTDSRFTDLYKWGRRTTPLNLAAEIQHQLLPSATTLEGAEFVLAGALEPADRIGGDTYDFTLDHDTVQVSITDAMGHDIEAALLATLLVGALRRVRRAGGGLAVQATDAHRAVADHGRGALATGQLLRVRLADGACELVNAGHPWPLRLRGGAVEELELVPDLPFGVPGAGVYGVQTLTLRPGDRIVLVTDGMLEREAGAVEIPALIRDTGHLHPREAAQTLTRAVYQAVGGRLRDDATVLCMDWRGPGLG